MSRFGLYLVGAIRSARRPEETVRPDGNDRDPRGFFGQDSQFEPTACRHREAADEEGDDRRLCDSSQDCLEGSYCAGTEAEVVSVDAVDDLRGIGK
jgi:hypothetical protein